jgi:hypothetical protein
MSKTSEAAPQQTCALHVLLENRQVQRRAAILLKKKTKKQEERMRGIFCFLSRPLSKAQAGRN